MSNPLPGEFFGTWRFANEKEVDGYNYLHFSPSPGESVSRIVQFFNIKDGSFDCSKMLVADIGGSKIEFFPEGGDEGWTRGFRFDEGNLVILEGEDEYPCDQMTDIPEWLSTGISEAQSYFDSAESDWSEGKKEA